MKTGQILFWLVVCGILVFTVRQLKVLDMLARDGVEITLTRKDDTHFDPQRLPYGTYERSETGMLVYKEPVNGKVDKDNSQKVTAEEAEQKAVEASNPGSGVYYSDVTQRYRKKDGSGDTLVDAPVK